MDFPRKGGEEHSGEGTTRELLLVVRLVGWCKKIGRGIRNAIFEEQNLKGGKL